MLLAEFSMNELTIRYLQEQEEEFTALYLHDGVPESALINV